PQYSEAYSIIPNVDDGARVWVNGVKVVDEWTGGAPRDLTATPIVLQANVPAKVVMEYYNGGNGSAKLQWQSASRTKQVIPAAFWRSEDPTYNQAPVLAGLSDRDGVAGAAVTLIPAASDDALPTIPGLVDYAWSRVFGPSAGNFSDVTSASTSFTSATPGSYLLRLQADDGEIRVAREFILNLIAPSQDFTTWIAGYTTLTGDDALTSADPDKDGIANLLEYALGTDPTNAASGSLPVVGVETIASSTYVTLTYNKDTSKSDIHYQVQSCSELAGTPTWSNVTDDLTGVTGQIEHRKASVLLDTSRKFLRLRVTQD
ncbi:MAG: hypothetical protein H7Y06_11295, partial [Opitutaceae bacterium]|nr:hypothetical protein [Opitutaceae bacterium]